MSTPDPIKAIELRINRINNVLHIDYLNEVHSDAEGYIDALYEFKIISEETWSSFSKEARKTRDETQKKLEKKDARKR